MTAVDDPSNRDDRYDRARLRKALVKNDFLDPVAVAASAAALADADIALDWMVAQLRSERLTQAGTVWTYDAQDLPRELRRRALVDCLRAIDPAAQPRGDAIARVLAALSDGKTVTIGKVRCRPVPDKDVWSFAMAPPRRAI
jgi:tRNA(Ile)-lysidine synthase